jgi:hypothetical protein
MEKIERTITAPDKLFVSSEEAATWLGVSADMFEMVMAYHNIESTRAMKKKKVWHWLDVVYAVKLIDKFNGQPE